MTQSEFYKISMHGADYEEIYKHKLYKYIVPDEKIKYREYISLKLKVNDTKVLKMINQQML